MRSSDDPDVRTRDAIRVVLWRHRHVLVLGIGVWLWWVMFYRLGALRHDRYWTFGFDLGLFNQAAWLVAHFKNPFITIRGLDVWGHHGNFIFYLFAPFYWLGAGPKFLLAAQLVSQACGAIGIYLLTRDRIVGSRWPGVILAAALLAHPSMQFLSWEYFHPETFAIGPIILAYWAGRTGRWKLFWVMAILAMSTKEDITFVFLVMGFVLMRRKEIRRGAILSGVALAWYLAVTKVLIPWRNPAGPFYEEHFYANYGGSIGSVAKTILRHPSRLWRDLTAHNRMILYWRLWFPVAFVPFLAPEVMAMMVPMFFVIVLASIPWVQDYRYHYVAVPLAITFLALVEAIAWCRRRWIRNGLLALVATTSLIGTLHWGPGPLAAKWNKGYWPHTRNESFVDILVGNLDSEGNWPTAMAKAAAVRAVPKNASVSATFSINPHLSSRTHVYEWPNPWIGSNWGICNDHLPDPATVDWIVIDRSSLDPGGVQGRLLTHLLNREFALRSETAGVVLAQRILPPEGPPPPSPTSCSTSG